MTCNYYLDFDICEQRKRPRETLHIGLSAVGWKFLFQFIEGKAENVDQWKELTKQGKIRDEYEREMNYGAFWTMVNNKQASKSATDMRGSEVFDVARYDFAKGEFT